MSTVPPADAPTAEDLAPVFEVLEVRHEDDRILYVGRPRAPLSTVESELAPLFYERGFDLQLTARSGDGNPEHVLVVSERSIGIDGVPWKNLALALATVLTTLYAGTVWYHVDVTADPLNLLRAWPFSLGILTILGVHEFGHYLTSRIHRVDASLPYFIPIPPPFGTAGAIIRMRGRIPNRKALLDIGASGPLAGIVATVVVTVIGLSLDPITVPRSVATSDAARIEFAEPLLLRGLAWLTGQPMSYADPTKQLHPLVFAGWLGMLVTFLNLLPVGQLDGGHVLRALMGPRQETVAAAVPAVLFGFAGVLLLVGDVSVEVGIWVVWGVFTTVLAFFGPATPIREEPLDRKRQAVGLLTFVVGVLCFMPVPFRIIV
ncbi:site-2 protease family protein [Halapricum hydrolyticum]|uniref:Site-2 protease family protein n=1 Tax=Halapricum hydrolyticum TaxID=2979991 RepID=A0AAE3LJF5_9EURY|nr:site-2 protease family protein [Halapricum hydrolyticum]MCU4718289.1 site-2 protease family protein [Halapricum hydrolyticum]MCU4727263.1 site-2 protease family protein [Halapricum hydrolyticum]